MEHHRICVAGSINVDLVAYVDASPEAARYSGGLGFQMSAGGKSLNTAMTIAALAPVQLLGRVGADDFGAFITRTLTAAGVDAHGLVVDAGAGTGVGHVRVSAAGEYDTVVVPGANNNFAPGDIDGFLRDNPAPEYAVLNLEVPFATTAHAARRFRGAGATVVLNLSPVVQAEARDLLPLADVVVLNADEARLVLGLDEEQDPDVLLQELHARGAAAVVLTLGSEGAAYIDDGGTRGRIAGTPATVVNTIGAGDSFLGGFVAALAARYPFRKALAFADAAGRTVCGKAASYLTAADRLHLTPVSAPLAPPTPKAPEPSHG
ncbi:ribokinase [Arthrobacter burdickii]|uniref:Ribokinase n=1 Tax=Arthrobacter burdickii TaxID=3035920 RepID=A0ABT8JWC6_9MICC|nr:ribokinase [Arthrobacter burdickii]MDN4609470.1 ribokinase [Arthrobacter burdickii]